MMEQVPFRRLFRPLNRPVPEDAEIVTAYTDGAVTLRSKRSKVGYHEAADFSGYQGVEPGDFVVHGLDIMRGSVGVSDASGAMSSVCIVCESADSLDPRFHAYVIRMQALSGFPKALARGVREGGADFRRWDTLAELPLPVVPLAEQRQIADFLDDQVSRIDAVVAARARQVALVEEKRIGELEFITSAAGIGLAREVRLATIATKIGSGKTPRGGGDAYVDSGVAFLRSQNVHNDGLRLDDVVYIDAPTDAEMIGTRVRAGDVLLNITGGSLGRCCVAASTALPANVSQHVCIIRVPGHDAEYIAASLQSPRIRRSIRMNQVGGNREGLNFEQVGSLTIYLPRDEVASVKAIRAANAEASRARTLLENSSKRLAEWKQSLISAAVTGEFDVTTTSTRAVPA